MPADLHIHTFHSPDAFTDPAALPDMAAAHGLSAYAVTDHNSLAGIDAARAAAEQASIEFVPGIELSLIYPDGSMRDTLAYWPDTGYEPLKQMAARMFAIHYEQGRILLDALIQEDERFAAGQAGKFLARVFPHDPQPTKWRLADYLYSRGEYRRWRDAAGYVQSFPYPAFAEDSRVAVIEDAVPILRAAGAVIILAHPGPVNDEHADCVSLIRTAVREAWIDGFEVWHMRNGDDLSAHLELAAELGCLATGGSDEHSRHGFESRIGNYSMPDSAFAAMKEQYCTLYGRLPEGM